MDLLSNFPPRSWMGEPLGYQKLNPVEVVVEEEDLEEEGVATEVGVVEEVDIIEVCNNNNNNLYLYSLLLKNKLQ